MKKGITSWAQSRLKRDMLEPEFILRIRIDMSSLGVVRGAW